MTRIFLTGGAGFIGSHTARLLLERGDEMILLDDFNDYYSPSQKEKNVEPLVKGGAHLYRGDIRDETFVKKIMTAERPKKILHLAARAGVRPSLQNPKLYEAVNVGGTLTLLEAARKHNVEQFVFASSSSVYGDHSPVPFSEDTPAVEPISPYAATKRAGELLAYTYHHLYQLPVTCLRFFTVYGPAGRPDMAPYLFMRAIKEGKPIQRFGDGSTQRDYTYIDDIISGVLAAVDHPFPYEIFNLGNHHTVSLNRFIETLEKILCKKAQIQQMPAQPGDVPITYANIEKAERLLGYQPQTNIENGLRRMSEWYLTYDAS